MVTFKFLRATFFIKHLRWLPLQMLCFTLYFQKDVVEYIVAIHCIIVSFWNLKLISFAFICFRSLCHTLSLVVPLVVIRYHSLCLIVIHCHSLSFVVIRCTTRCHSFVVTRCHSLSLGVPLVYLFINDQHKKRKNVLKTLTFEFYHGGIMILYLLFAFD